MPHNLEPTPGDKELFTGAILDLGIPTITSVNYTYEIDSFFVSDNGAIIRETTPINNIGGELNVRSLSESLGESAKSIGWIDLHANAQVVLRNSEAAINLGNRDNWLSTEQCDVEEQTALFRRFRLGEQMFAVAYKKSTNFVTWQPRSEVEAAENLPIHMKEWLKKIASPYRTSGFQTLAYYAQLRPFIDMVRSERTLF